MEYGIQQGYNPLTSASYTSPFYASQPGQPAMFGNATAPFGGLIGSGIGGLLGGQNIGRQPGQGVDGIGGMFQSSPNIDPVTAAQIQTAQLAQQAQVAQQLQLAQQAQLAQQQYAQLVQQAQLAQQLAQQQQFGRPSPFGVDPISAALLQQRAQIGQQVGINPLNRIDPITAAYVQQAQVAQLHQQLGQQLNQQLGQQNQFGHPHTHFGQGQFGQAWPGAGQNLWANPLLTSQFGRTVPQYGLGAPIGFGSQLPMY
jgi:hypothetical protein